MHDAPIVVGIEDTAEAAEALRWAAMESRRTEAPLVAVLAYGHDAPGASPALTATQESVARSWATHWLRDVLSHDAPPWRTHLVVVPEAADSALARYSRDAALLVLGRAAMCREGTLCPVVTMPAGETHGQVSA